MRNVERMLAMIRMESWQIMLYGDILVMESDQRIKLWKQIGEHMEKTRGEYMENAIREHNWRNRRKLY